MVVLASGLLVVPGAYLQVTRELHDFLQERGSISDHGVVSVHKQITNGLQHSNAVKSAGGSSGNRAVYRVYIAYLIENCISTAEMEKESTLVR